MLWINNISSHTYKLQMSTLEHKNVTNEVESLTKNDVKDDVKGLDVESDNGSMVTLISSDGIKFEVSEKDASVSKLIKSYLENGKDKIVSFENVNEDSKKILTSEFLTEVVKFMKEHKGTPPDIPLKPLRSKLMKDVTTKWNAEFLDEMWENRRPFIYKFITTVNHLDITELVYLVAARIAAGIKGQPLENLPSIICKCQEDKIPMMMGKDGKDEKKNE